MNIFKKIKWPIILSDKATLGCGMFIGFLIGWCGFMVLDMAVDGYDPNPPVTLETLSQDYDQCIHRAVEYSNIDDLDKCLEVFNKIKEIKGLK